MNSNLLKKIVAIVLIINKRSKSMNKYICGVVFFAVFSNAAIAAKIPNCKNNAVPRAEVDDLRTAKSEAVNGRGTVFNNNEGILPGLSHNETYREYDLGADRSGGRGAHRAVLNVLEGSKRKVQAIYYTDTHYQSFCKLNQ